MRFDGKWVIFMFLGRMNMGRIPMRYPCKTHAVFMRLGSAWVPHECRMSVEDKLMRSNLLIYNDYG